MSTPKSWKVEVQADNTRTWKSNQLRFATKEEAEIYGKELWARWTAVKEWRAAGSEDAVTDHIVGGVAVSLDKERNAIRGG